MTGAAQRFSVDSPPLPAQLGTSWPGPSNGAHEPASVPPNPSAGLVAKGGRGRLLGWNPLPDLGTVQSRSGQKVKRCQGPSGSGPLHLPLLQAGAAHTRMLSGFHVTGTLCLNEHALCPIITRLLQRQWPVEAWPAWGLRPWEAPCMWAWRWGKGGDWWSWPPLRPDQGYLALHYRIPGSASSLTGSPPRECLGQTDSRGQARWGAFICD